jgi:hypothetical protein
MVDIARFPGVRGRELRLGMREHRRVDLRHTISYVLVALLTLGAVVSLPVALVSLITDLRQGTEELIFSSSSSENRSAPIHFSLDFTTINVSDGYVDVRVTAALACAPTCPDRARVNLFSLLDGSDTDLPVIKVLEFSQDPATVTEVVSLPITGDPIRYPFDRWNFRVSIVPLRVLADGSKQEIPPGDPAGSVTVRVTNRIPRMRMQAQAVAQGQPTGATPIAGQGLMFDFGRPEYLKIVTVLLVVLVGAASAYAVFLRPLSELLINAGALVLGVWGIRAILLKTELTFMTAVDLALIGVILFLLVMVTVRTLWVLEGRSRLRPLRSLMRRCRTCPSDRPAPEDPERG